jgi:hypothetical protein
MNKVSQVMLVRSLIWTTYKTTGPICSPRLR